MNPAEDIISGKCSFAGKEVGMSLRKLCIQIQPARVPALDEALVLGILEPLGQARGLRASVRVREGDEGGRYINVIYATEDLPGLWSLIRKEALEHAGVGSNLRKATIITCQGDAGWDNYLLLHHFNEAEQLDSLESSG